MTGNFTNFLKKHDVINDRKPTNQLYLLPIFLGLFGGVLIYLIAKKDNQKMAKNGFVLGIVIELIFLIIIVFLTSPPDPLALFTV